MTDHSQTVHNQFDPQAAAYLTSRVHAEGPDLKRAAETVSAAIPAYKGKGLDIGCGAGHLAYALAPHLNCTVACDPSPAMLATVAQTAKLRGLTIETVQASADALPFADGEFCVVASRYSAHHWRNLPVALKAMRRVVKTGGYLLMIDVLGDEDDLVDTHLQAIEVLRDRSHLRNLKASQWRDLIAASGFEMVEEADWPLPLDFSAWVTRMRTSDQRAAMIRTLLDEAPAEVRDALKVQADGSFTLKTGLFWAKAV
ncbi:class I SAM-dependent methyltransferase [Asticcacaulis sp. EMRT-3]|uniref:class I SAM-dependent methyltransferase n=1 Tax=Asticcacaulis sp. EMRT-3 TaxID=3040349 RepID=UPI0024AF89A5|nr:class I SAM-dependent methyltransferase [Asticcacaulis sp. EMRT-3]MDI7774176.1 class I SAM-dependent methyltransferase [Asticcacaulis sp. EMRT-3]